MPEYDALLSHRPDVVFIEGGNALEVLAGAAGLLRPGTPTVVREDYTAAVPHRPYMGIVTAHSYRGYTVQVLVRDLLVLGPGTRTGVETPHVVAAGNRPQVVHIRPGHAFAVEAALHIGPVVPVEEISVFVSHGAGAVGGHRRHSVYLLGLPGVILIPPIRAVVE